MDAITENSIRQDQVEFFGRIMAGISHDMKNHLGIIRESSGLMDDIISMSALGEDDILVERLQKSTAAIERRVVIAANMLHHLSGMAHRPDSACSSFLVNDLIVELCTFLERFSRLRQIKVAFSFEESLTALYNDPALLQYVFHQIYIQCLEFLAGGQELRIITKQEESSSAIIFCFPSDGEPLNYGKLTDKTLLAAVEKLHAVLTTTDNERGVVEVRLTVPSLPE